MSAPAPRIPPQPDRLTRALSAWYGYLSAHRILLTCLLALMGFLFSAASARIRWQADILQFFSSNSEEVANLQRLAAEPGLTNQFRLDVHFTPSSSSPDPAMLPDVVRELAARLTATHEFQHVWTGVPMDRQIAAYASLHAQAPLLLAPADLDLLQTRLTPAYLNTRFAAVAAGLADPDGEIRSRQLQSDPLNLSDLLSDRLKSIAPTQQASFQDGLLTATDDRGSPHIMLVLEPIARPSDTPASERMLTAIHAAITDITHAHPNTAVWAIGPHRGYVENAAHIKRDVTWVSALGSLAVALAIFLYFRRFAPVLICMIPPTIGLGLALGLAGLAHAQLPLIVLGFGGLLCGSTTDYGIQLIAACNRRAAGLPWSPDLPAVVARQLLGPISMSVATSVTGFAALGLSASPGLRALGLFVALATLCIWLITFLVLPAYLGPWVITKRPLRLFTFRFPLPLRIAATLLFLAATVWLAKAALHVRFNTDPRALDGSSPALRADEANFYRVWGDLRHRAIVLVESSSPQAALATLARVSHYLADQQQDNMLAAVITPANLLPDDAAMQAAAKRWQTFWTPSRLAQLRETLTAAARANHFKPAAWDTFLTQLPNPPAILPASQRIADSPAALLPGFIRTTPEKTTLAAIVQMRTDTSLRLSTAWADELRLRFPEVAILSGNLLIFDATERARAEGESLFPATLIAILLPLWIYFRRIRPTMLSALCLAVGFLWVLGVAQAFAGGLIILSLIPILMTLGVAIDYGIYAATDPANTQLPPAAASRSPATFLCAVTTLLGSGALAFAPHPVLRWLGLTLIAGIAGGYLTSLLIVAPLTRYFTQRAACPPTFYRRWSSRLGRLALVALILLIAIPPVGEFLLAHQHPSSPGPLPTATVLQTADQTWTVGSSWMRKRNAGPPNSPDGLWELSISGSPEDLGYAAANLGAPIDSRIENEMLDQLDTLLPEEWSRYLVLRSVALNLLNLPAHVPPYLQRELYASSRAHPDPRRYLAATYPRLLSYHALHDISQMLIDNPLIVAPSAACTGVISCPAYSGNDHLYLARNFDFEGGASFGRQKSITYVYPTDGIPFATIAWPGLAGCVTGMNQQKIALFINAAATQDFRRIGTPTIFIAREVLQRANTLDEAERIIRAANVFVSDIIVIADGKTGQARVLEKSPADTAVYPVLQSAVVANHLITPRFANDPVNRERRDDGTTLQRSTRARELLDRLQNHMDEHTLAALLRDKKGPADQDLGLGNRNAIDALIACHSVIIDVTAGKLWVATWPHAEGPFLGVDLLQMLSSPGPAGLALDFSSLTLPPDAMMTSDGWNRHLKSKVACDQSLQALCFEQYATAQSAALQAVAANPNFYLGHELLGRAFLGLQNPAAAKLELNTAPRLDPPYAQRRAYIEGLIKQCQN